MKKDTRPFVHTANVCFIVEMLGEGNAMVKIISASKDSDQNLVSRSFKIPDWIPLANVKLDPNGFGGYGYTVKGMGHLEESDIAKKVKINAFINHDERYNWIRILGATEFHFLANLLSMREQNQKKPSKENFKPAEDESNNPLAPAFDKAFSGNGLGTSDEGMGADMDEAAQQVTDVPDLRSTQRTKQSATRKSLPKTTNQAA